MSIDIFYVATKKSTQSKAQTAVDRVAVGRRIRELRGFDMTQAEFARRIGITQGHLSRLERGEKEPGATVLLAISQEFGQSVDWLLMGNRHVEPKKRVAEEPPQL